MSTTYTLPFEEPVIELERQIETLAAREDAESIAELFTALDANSDGVISREEWTSGFDRFLGLATSPAKKAPPGVDYCLEAPAAVDAPGEADAGTPGFPASDSTAADDQLDTAPSPSVAGTESSAQPPAA